MTRADLVRAALAHFDWLALISYTVALAVAVLMSCPVDLATLGIIVFGLVSWVGSEYVFHRYVLHLPLVQIPGINWAQRRVHHQHHRTPGDLGYVFITWWASPPLLLLGAGLGRLVWGEGAWLPSMLGYSIALVVYNLMHFAAHVPYRPRTRWGTLMKRYHLLHHFKNERYWFGVTTPLVDLLVATWPAANAVEKSSTVRDLEGDGSSGFGSD